MNIDVLIKFSKRPLANKVLQTVGLFQLKNNMTSFLIEFLPFKNIFRRNGFNANRTLLQSSRSRPQQ